MHSRRVPEAPDWQRELGARFVALEELLERSDIVSLHCPLSRETHHLIDAAALTRMKSTAVLVNTARGAIVDESALVVALRAGAIACAGLDVYEDEPRLAPGLAELENVVLLPHIGSATHAAREAMGRLCADAVIAELSGRAAPNRRGLRLTGQCASPPGTSTDSARAWRCSCTGSPRASPTSWRSRS